MNPRHRPLRRTPFTPARSPLGRALAACLTIAATCLFAIGCKAAFPRLPDADASSTISAETPVSPAAPSSADSTPTAPPRSTPEIGDDIARLLKNPPPPGQVIEIDAYTFLASPRAVPGGLGWNASQRKGLPPPLTDQPYFPSQNIFSSHSYRSPPQDVDLPWIWAIGDFPDLDLATWPDRPVRYRLRGRLGEHRLSDDSEPTTVFFVDEILSSQPVDCLPGDCELFRDLSDWQTYRDEASGISVPVPPGWSIRNSWRRRTQFIDPYHSDWPIELERLDEAIDTRTTRQLGRGEIWDWFWIAHRVRVRAGEPAELVGDTLTCLTYDARKRPTSHYCIGVAFTLGDRAWILRMHYPRGYGASPGQLRTFEAMLKGLEIEGWPTVTPEPTRQSEIGGGPFLSAEQAGQRAKDTTIGGPWQVDETLLVSESDAAALQHCRMDLPERPDDPSRKGALAGVWVVYFHGRTESGQLEHFASYVNATTGDRICVYPESKASQAKRAAARPPTPKADPRPSGGAPSPDLELTRRVFVQVHESRWMSKAEQGWHRHEELAVTAMIYNRSAETLEGLEVDFGLPDGASLVEAVRMPRGARLLAGANAPRLRLPSLPGGSAAGPIVLLVDQLVEPARVSVLDGEAWHNAGPPLLQDFMSYSSLSGFPGQGSLPTTEPGDAAPAGMNMTRIEASDDFPDLAGMRWCSIDLQEFGKASSDGLRQTICLAMLRPAAVADVYFRPETARAGSAAWRRLADAGSVSPDGRSVLYRATESGYYATGVRSDAEESGLIGTDTRLFADLVAAISRAATEDPAYSAIGHPAVILYALELAGDEATNETFLRFQSKSRPALICRASGCVTGGPDTRIVDAGDGGILLDAQGSPGPAADETRVKTGFGFALPDVVRIGTVSGRARIEFGAGPAEN